MKPPMTTEHRKEIEERVAAATPGPWRVGQPGDRYTDFVTVIGTGERKPYESEAEDLCILKDYPDENQEVVGASERMRGDDDDFDFIAHARSDIPALLSALDAAEARAKAAEEALKECYGCVEDGKPSHVFDVVDAYFKAQESDGEHTGEPKAPDK